MVVLTVKLRIGKNFGVLAGLPGTSVKEELTGSAESPVILLNGQVYRGVAKLVRVSQTRAVRMLRGRWIIRKRTLRYRKQV